MVSFRVNRISGFDIIVPGLTLTATDQSGVNGTSMVSGGVPNNNGDWLFKQNTGFITVTLKPGLTIPANGSSAIGFRVMRKSGTISGTNQNITATILSNSGGEVLNSNNRVITNLGAND